ncbi:MAG: LysR substrate-binding domain-containing protein [Rhodospirillales bacterium]
MQGLLWEDLRLALLLSRGGSLAAVAQRLDVNETTVGRRLVRAERRLGARLFQRQAGRLVLTAAGARLVGHAERMEAEARQAEEALSGGDARVVGRIRLTAVPLVANCLLTPALPSLLERHPELEIDLIAEASSLSVLRREVDLALRLARPERELLAIARQVGALPYAPFLAAGLDSDAAPWIGYEAGMGSLPQARWIDRQIARPSGRAAGLRVYDGETLLQALRAGLGQSLLPLAIGAAEPALRQAGPVCLSRPLWLMLHPESKDLARVRATLDWLVALFSSARAPTW